MFRNTEAYSGFAVDDLDQARRFYGEVLGLPVSEVEEMPQLMTLHLAGDRPVLVYQKPDFVPATYTILNFAVPDVGKAAAELADRGVAFERYEGFSHDEDGVVRGMGPDIAWFKDPAGNVLSVVQQADTTSGG